MAQRAGVSFEVDRLELEDDRLVVSGFWSGVRGLRFVRPTLVSDDRRILATLEHKPWAPSADAPWTAAFPWDGDAVDADRLTLAVSPQVTVPLGDGPVAEDPPPAPVIAIETAEGSGRAARRAARAAAAPTDASAPQALAATSPLLALAGSLGPQDEPEPRGEPAPDRRPVEAHRRAEVEDELARRRSAAERDRDRALEQLAEAVAAREAAVRTRARMQLAHDEALQAREAAESALARARAERDEAVVQRDEVLLAYRTLQRQVHSEQAGHDRAAGPRPAAAAGVPAPAADDEPIGVRTLPAARGIAPELQHPRREQKLVLSQFDLWIIRALGTVAAGCFILLLVSILRVFL